MTKAELRVAMRAARLAHVAALAPDDRAALEAALAERLRTALPAGATAGAYSPVGSEIDPRRVAAPLAYPWFADTAAPLRFRLGPPTAPGPFGIPQPLPDAPLVEPGVLIIPLLAATPRGLRLGQGGGHYDRHLAARRDAGTPPLAIGTGFDMQIVDHLPADPWDMRLDFVVTPTRTFDCRR